MRNICFVCVGNTCRSPMAEKIFSDMVKKAKIKNISVSSAGISAVNGTQMSINAKRALKKLGYKVGSKKSSQLTLILPNVLYIAMSDDIKAYIRSKNVLSFREIVNKTEVKDPYGQSQAVYDMTAKQIEEYCKLLLEKVMREHQKN